MFMEYIRTASGHNLTFQVLKSVKFFAGFIFSPIFAIKTSNPAQVCFAHSVQLQIACMGLFASICCGGLIQMKYYCKKFQGL